MAGLLAGNDIGTDYLEECINKQDPIEKILRLLCLTSVTNNGIKQKQYEFLKREIIQVREALDLLTKSRPMAINTFSH
jgi:hypothetical protein